MLRRDYRIFTNLLGTKPVTLEGALNDGLWKDLDKLFAKGPIYILEQIKISQLRGRSGSGKNEFDKWKEVKDGSGQKYVIINGDETEPGTCKDRNIMLYEPYRVLEGALIAGYTVGANKAFIYVRGEYSEQAKQLQKAIDKLRVSKYIGPNNKFNIDFDIHIHQNAGAYIAGEQSAQVSSLEGGPALPKPKPPTLGIRGLYGRPTLVNNVETISAASAILRRGGDWFASIGPEKSKGPKVFCISGAVKKQTIFEEEMGMSVIDLINEYAGGTNGNIKGIIPGGLSTPILKADELNTRMDFESMAAAGSALGTAAMVVIPENYRAIDLLQFVTRFFVKECCGKCTNCTNYGEKMFEITQKIAAGKGRAKDLEELRRISSTSENAICSFIHAERDPVRAILNKYESELKELLV